MIYKPLDMKDGDAFDLVRSARVAGRKITVLGGGTGLSTLLLGLKEYTDNITAVVTVADDGGGSGVIRRHFGMLPPGDIRNCILALANTSSTMSALLNYRFTDSFLEGQNFGNLFLLALNGISPSFEAAVERMNQFLAVTGRVLPVTNRDVALKATFENDAVVYGETEITGKKKKSGLAIKKMELEPGDVDALPSVIEAIGEADIIVLGPGSLYSSIIPNLLVNGVSEAIKRSSALKIYALNIMTQEGETENYTATKHIEEINRHARGSIIDVCLYNSEMPNKKMTENYKDENSVPLVPFASELLPLGIKLFGANMLAHDMQYARHDPLRLAYNILAACDKFAPRDGILREYDKLLLRRE